MSPSCAQLRYATHACVLDGTDPVLCAVLHVLACGPLSCTGGLQEVRRLEKLRAKRAFEATPPPIDDVERLPERQAMIEAWEVQEWIEREEEIKGVQEERLALLAQALQVGGQGCSQRPLHSSFKTAVSIESPVHGAVVMLPKP